MMAFTPFSRRRKRKSCITTIFCTCTTLHGHLGVAVFFLCLVVGYFGSKSTTVMPCVLSPLACSQNNRFCLFCAEKWTVAAIVFFLFANGAIDVRAGKKEEKKRNEQTVVDNDHLQKVCPIRFESAPHTSPSWSGQFVCCGEQIRWDPNICQGDRQ